MSNDIPILEFTKNPQDDPAWTTMFGHLAHPNFSNPVFYRHNGSTVNLFNLYNGETVYLIGRGLSIEQALVDKKTRQLLFHPSIIKYGMNSAPDVMDFNVNLWSCVDPASKFAPQILKNPNIVKLIPLNRFRPNATDPRQKDLEKTLAYTDGINKVYTSLCPNTFGVQTFLLSQDSAKHISFGNAFLGCPAVLYGYFKGHKCVLLYAIKLALLLGFRRIVLIGVDFKMDKAQPYFRNTSSDFNEFHVQHNNNLYEALAPMIQDICKILASKESPYQCQIVTASKIKLMPFIPTVDLKKTLEEEIALKSR